MYFITNLGKKFFAALFREKAVVSPNLVTFLTIRKVFLSFKNRWKIVIFIKKNSNSSISKKLYFAIDYVYYIYAMYFIGKKSCTLPRAITRRLKTTDRNKGASAEI
jgi:hypothetical protein